MAKPQKARGPSTTQAETQPRAGPRPVAVPAPAEIAARAYEIWQESGRPEGKQEEHWYTAERELRTHSTRNGRT